MTMFTGDSLLITLVIIGMSSMVICQVPTVCKDQYFADQFDCTKFYVCVHGQPISQSCPGPLHWNDQHKTCDWEYSANCVANNNQHSQQPHQPTNQWAAQPQPQQPQQASQWGHEHHQAPAPPQQAPQPINHWAHISQPQQPHQQINQWGHQSIAQHQPIQQINHWANQPIPQQQQIQQVSDWGHGHQPSSNNGYNPSAAPQVNHQDYSDYPEYEDEEPMQINQQPAHVKPNQSSFIPDVPNQTNTRCGPEKKSVCYCKYELPSTYLSKKTILLIKIYCF